MTKIADLLKKDWKTAKEELIVATCFMQSMVYKFDPSNFQGERLKNYFISEICCQINSNNLEDVCIEHMEKYEDYTLSDNESIIVIGTHKAIDGEKNENIFITIFKRQEKNIFDFIFHTDAQYEIVYFVESESVPEGQHMFEYVDMEFHDLDMDGDDEIILDFKTIHATTTSIYTLIMKNKNDKWNMILPDFSNIQDSINKISDEYEAITTEMSIYDRLDNREYIVYGMCRNGSLNFPLNPLFDIPDFCYKIPLLKPHQALMSIDTYAYIMLRLDGMKLVADNSWNFGETLIEESMESEEVYSYYGMQKNGIIYYTNP